MPLRRRIGPHAERPHFVISRTLQEAPRLYRVTSQNHQSRRLYGEDLQTGQKLYLPMDDVLATHHEEDDARQCFKALSEQIDAIDGAVYRARRALEDAEQARRRALREIAIGNAFAQA